MKLYTGTFIKSSGKKRMMRFFRLKELPKEFVSKYISGSGTPKILKEGTEIVYDFDEHELRIFNWNTLVGDIVEEEIGTKLDEKSG